MQRFKSLTFAVRVVRVKDDSETLWPYVTMPDGALQKLGAGDTRRLKDVLLDEFDVDSVPELVEKTQNDTKESYKLCTATVTENSVEIDRVYRFCE